MNRYFIVAVMYLLMTACSTINVPPTEFEIGDEVLPPIGCVELRKTNPEADC